MLMRLSTARAEIATIFKGVVDSKTMAALRTADANGKLKSFVLNIELKAGEAEKITDFLPKTPNTLKPINEKPAITVNDTTGEVNANVQTEDVDNNGTVLQSDLDRQGDSRVLDEVEAGDVSGATSDGRTVESAELGGREIGRDDNRPDQQRAERGHGKRSSESGDLRRDGGLSAEQHGGQQAQRNSGRYS